MMRSQPELFIGKRRTESNVERLPQNRDRSLQDLGIKTMIGGFASEPMNKTFRAFETNAGT
jgi:hypothetical protein